MDFRLYRRLGLVTVAMVSGLVVGCGRRGTPTYPVSGTVTFDGQALPEGDILFVPLEKSHGPTAGKIKQGRFTFQAIAGTQRVEIHASRPIPGAPLGPMDLPPREAYIPLQYNEQSELTAEVVPEGRNEFAFQLSSDPPR